MPGHSIHLMQAYSLNAGTTFLVLEIALGTLVVLQRGILQGSEFTCDVSFMLFVCLVLCTSTRGAAVFEPSAYSMSGALLPANVPRVNLTLCATMAGTVTDGGSHESADVPA